MKLYHYVARLNNVLEEGILSFAKNPQADLSYYYKRSGATTHEGVVEWFESCFEGRSRGIRAFSEPIQWTENSLKLKEFIENADMFSIDLDALEKDGFLEALYLSPSVLDIPDIQDYMGRDEVLEKLSGVAEISTKPIDWSVCNDKLGRRFAYVPYYVLIIKDGVIPPKYLIKET